MLEELGAEVTAVEEDVVGAGLAHPSDDRARHDVARRQVGERVLALHEALPRRVDEEGALAAHRLGDERLLAARALAEPEHGRVELHELEVGEHGTGAERRGHAVAGRDGRVRRRGVDLPETAGREHDGARVRGADPVDLALADDVEGDAADPLLGVLEQVDDEGVLDDLDARVVPHPVEGRDERPADLPSRRVAAGVQDAVAVVAALAGQRQAAARRGRTPHRAR